MRRRSNERRVGVDGRDGEAERRDRRAVAGVAEGWAAVQRIARRCAGGGVGTDRAYGTKLFASPGGPLLRLVSKHD